jgi:simple sugar transport system substrate-binding protein
MAWLERRFGTNPMGLVHLQGQLGASAQVGRTEAVDAALARNRGWTMLARQTGDWGTDRGRAVMTVWIQQFGNRINAVFAENDNMALGAIQALQEAGMRVGGRDGVAIVTVDANRWSLQMTLEGLINYNVECNPLLGPGIFEIIDNHRRGINPPKRSTVVAQTFAFDTITQAIIDARAY